MGLPRAGYPKDAINDHIVGGDRDAVNPHRFGTKAAAHYHFNVPAGGEARARLRLSPDGGGFDDFAAVLRRRREEADAFYDALQVGIGDPEARRVQRQAFAGMLWSKQYYYFDVRQWLQATRSIRRRRRGSGAQRRLGPPRTPPGTWRFTASCWPRSMPTSPRSS